MHNLRRPAEQEPKKRNMFTFKQFTISQDKTSMKVGTDGVLLGALTDSENPNSILDIGTGTGLISLMLAQKFPGSRITAIDISADAFNQAEENFKNSKWSDNLKAIQSSLQDFSNENQINFDLIVSNPPYFKTPEFEKGNNSQRMQQGRVTARTNSGLTFPELIKNASLLLKENGAFWVIIPSFSSSEFISIAKNDELYLSKKIEIRSFPESSVIRDVLCFTKQQGLAEIHSINIYEEAGKYSEEYYQLTKDFYLWKGRD